MEWQHFYKWLTDDTEEAFSAFETETGSNRPGADQTLREQMRTFEAFVAMLEQLDRANVEWRQFPAVAKAAHYLHDQVAITAAVLSCRGATRQQFRVMQSRAELAAATAAGEVNVYTMTLVLEHNELVHGNGLVGRGRGARGGRGGRGGRSGGRGVQAGGRGFETRGRGFFPPAQLSIAAPPVVAAPAVMYQAPQQRSGGYGGGRR
jgi:hypothetical protein